MFIICPSRWKEAISFAAAVKMSTSPSPRAKRGETCKKRRKYCFMCVCVCIHVLCVSVCECVCVCEWLIWAPVQTRAEMLMVLLSKMTLTSVSSYILQCFRSPHIFPLSAVFVYHCVCVCVSVWPLQRARRPPSDLLLVSLYVPAHVKAVKSLSGCILFSGGAECCARPLRITDAVPGASLLTIYII